MNIILKIVSSILLLFLSLVSIGYIYVGINGITRHNWFFLPGIAYQSMVVPLPLVSSAVVCIASWGGDTCPNNIPINLGTEQNAYLVIQVLSVTAIIFGFISLFGVITMWMKKKIGYRMWLFFIILWNLLSYFQNPTYFGDDKPLQIHDLIYSFIWCATYTLSYLGIKKINLLPRD